jgi:hypothetical protein
VHQSLLDELSSSLEKMKFACNHKRDFVDWKLAFLGGFFQAVIVSTVEFVCIFVVIMADKPLDIAFNFAGMAIIADFDNLIYDSVKHEFLKKLLFEEIRNRVIIVRNTTSKRCQPTEKPLKSEWYSALFDLEDLDTPIKIQAVKRSWFNWILYMVYKGFRIYYVSFYVYFMPFLTVMLSIGLPLLNCYATDGCPNLNDDTSS